MNVSSKTVFVCSLLAISQMSVAHFVGYLGTSSREFMLDSLEQIKFEPTDVPVGFVSWMSKGKTAFEVQSLNSMYRLLHTLKKDTTLADGVIALASKELSPSNRAVYDDRSMTNADKSMVVAFEGAIDIRLYKQSPELQKKFAARAVASMATDAAQKFGSLVEIFAHLGHLIPGNYAYAAMMQKHPETMVVVSKNTPVYVGRAAGELFVGTDKAVVAAYAVNAAKMPDRTFALITRNAVDVYDFNGKKTAQLVGNAFNVVQ